MSKERTLPESAAPDRNILGEPLVPCSLDPMTGWFRNGCCDTNDEDRGSHTVCVRVTAEFLAFSQSVGNDLSTPVAPSFPGLVPGDQWCLCAPRWEQARRAGKAPHVLAASTHERALESCALEHLLAHALDVS